MIDPLLQLHRLAGAAGIDSAYRDIDGRLRVAGPEALLAILRALGIPIDRLDQAGEARRSLVADASEVEPVHVAWDGRLSPIRRPGHVADVAVTLATEDGRVLPLRTGDDPQRLRFPDTLPLGVHTLHIDAAGVSHESCVISAPRRAAAPISHPSWGLFFPLYAVGDGATGHGTYGDLAEAACRVGAAGGAFVGTLPLLASFLDGLHEPSPYTPASRLFWNDLFLEPGALADSGNVRAPLLDYRAAAEIVRPRLQAKADAFFSAGGERDVLFRAFLERRPRAPDYARFRAACDRYRTGFAEWPSPARDGTLTDADVDPAAVRRHLYATWQAELALAKIARQGSEDHWARLYLDLALGVHGQGYDVWRERALFAGGIAVGAPPDPLFRGGQNWGFQPLLPTALRRTGHAYVREVLQHHMRCAGALRIDHVMSLVRLYWIPDGFPATEGVYVRYPRDELLALLTLESARHDTLLIGEDLGTVPGEVRTAMKAHGLLRMHVLQFAFGAGAGWPHVPAGVAASLDTHDTPTFAGFWRGLDIDDQVDLGMLEPDAAQRARQGRARVRQRVARALGTDTVPAEDAALDGALRHLARSDADFVVVALEDLWLETNPQNVPGTRDERPNWRRRARRGIRAAFSDAQVTRRLRMVDRLRKERSHDRS